MECWRKIVCLFNSNFANYKKCISYDNYSIDKCEAEHRKKKIRVIKDLNYEITGEMEQITHLIGKEFRVVGQEGGMIIIDIGNGDIEALFKSEYEWIENI